MKKKHRIKSEPKLQAEAPDILRKLKWLHLYGSKHKGYIVLAVLVIFSGLLLKMYFNSDQLSKTVPPIRIDQNKDIEARKDKKPLPILSIVFKDGYRAQVALSTNVQVDPEKVIYVIKQYGEQERAIDDLTTSIRNKAISVLERHSLVYVRQNRLKISELIIQECAEDAKRTGHKINTIAISEINVLGISP